MGPDETAGVPPVPPAPDAEAPADREPEVAAFQRAHPDVETVDAIFADLSGVIRGKRYPIADLPKLYRDGIALPGSAFLLDALGENHDPLGRGFSDGDPDVVAWPIPGTLVPVPWAERPRAQVLLNFRDGDGGPYAFDPRNVLAATAECFAPLGLAPVVAFELEFYLIDPERTAAGAPQPPVSPVTGERDSATQVYGMADVDAYAPLLEDIVACCQRQGVPSQAITAEYAPGQFEINLGHVPDPLRAADHCVMFQRAVRHVARRHGLQATFMAKPYPDEVGSGMHLHVSLVDGAGRNVFDGGPDHPVGAKLEHAMAGILETLPEAMAFLAPNHNAYRRFQPMTFVPLQRSWGLENRSVTLRVPLGAPEARRIEHRMAGADANPYLALATALAGIHHGLTHELAPGAPFAGNAGERYDPGVPWRPRRALEALAAGQVLRGYFGGTYVDAYVACKSAEMDKFESEITEAEYRWFLKPA
jgi:glutamine synthetase